MDPLLPMLLAALLLALGDRPLRVSTLLAERHQGHGAILAAVLVAALANSAIAAAGAALIAPMLHPRAAALLLALALLAAGAAALFPRRPVDVPDDWRLGGFLTSLIILFNRMLGDATGFLVFGIAVWAGQPVMTAIGAAIGTTGAIAAAVLVGADFQRLPLTLIRRLVAALFLLLGIWAALTALAVI